jgi:hypothetical protein
VLPLREIKSPAGPFAASAGIPLHRPVGSRQRDSFRCREVQRGDAARLASPTPDDRHDPRCASALCLHRLQALRTLVAGIRYLRSHRKGFHPLTGERHEQGLERIGGRARIQPRIFGRRVEDDGHPVMERPHQFVGRGRQDGARLYRLALRLAPLLPQPGEREQSAVTRPDEVRQLAATEFLPFVEPGRGDEAPPLFERRPKGRLCCCGHWAPACPPKTQLAHLPPDFSNCLK